MPSRLSKLFSASEKKEKEALAEAERNRDSSSSSPPPGYEQEAPEYDRDNVLQPPDITAGFRDLNITQSGGDGIPQSNECIAHLKLLECFYRLKQAVGSHGQLFGIKDDCVTRFKLAEDKKSELLAKLAEKRWSIYVQRAVDRFETWWAAITPAARMASRQRLDLHGKQGQLIQPQFQEGPEIRIDRTNMPPVDVLMVWHAYMLNPRAYLEDCLRYGRMPLWHTPMPWQVVSQCVNAETFVFETGSPAQEAWTSNTGLPWDNLEDARDKIVYCPLCNTRVSTPWTTCPEYSTEKYGLHTLHDSDIDHMLSSGHGFCDRDFRKECTKCQEVLSHDRLRAGKFCNDTKKLIHDDVPLGGTVLGHQGIPGVAFGKKDVTSTTALLFPNALFKEGLGQAIINNHAANPIVSEKTVDNIRKAVEDAMRDRKYMRKVRNSHSHTPLRTEKICIRKMMSRYWDNSSPFALHLVGAVIRQGSFIEKMHNIDWLHSPALPNTTARLIQKYIVFMAIMATYPTQMAVPTLDVDLAWHTHQLNPAKYMEYTVKLTKQFIDHDDKVAETKLNDSFAWTSKAYQKMTGQPYSECTCWYCEAIRESHTSSASRLFNTSSAKAADMLHDVEQDPKKSVHISAHNAVRTHDGDPKYEAQSKAKADLLEKHYQKACERARKKGKPAPKRDDYYYSDAYGYPVYIPAYSPFIYVPYAPMYYPVTPGCMAVGAGAVGGCCTGTCGGGVAAGGCGGSGGAGGCAGGAAGGCGGGSGGGGGCGGGGGGGGCGGGGGGGC